MAIPKDWRCRTSVAALVDVLEGISRDEYHRAEVESRYNYIERTIYENGKPRNLCYSPKNSILRKVQDAIKRDLLSKIELSPSVRGYTKGAHNINVAAVPCQYDFVGKLDIAKYHPSINTGHVANALVKHGLSWPWARRIARLVTYRGRVPQGAPTSNHIANLVVDNIFRRSVVPFARRLKVTVINYGDDIALCSNDSEVVHKCARYVQTQLEKHGFLANDKGRDCEHRGSERLFLGCCTGREHPDLPRKRYRSIRRELRALLRRERKKSGDSPVTTERQVRSIRQRIAYVQRLNQRKARRLKDVFYRICAARI